MQEKLIVLEGRSAQSVLVTDPDGTVHIEQHGRDHASLTVQSGEGGQLRIESRPGETLLTATLYGKPV